MRGKWYARGLVAVLCWTSLNHAVGRGDDETIRKVEHVRVEAPKGTVPRLPYRVLVTYANGKRAYRQVRWENASSEVEQEEADSLLHPVGQKYKVRGFLLGDNTTEKGYPLTAEVHVVSKGWVTPSPQFKAEPLPLIDVSLIGDNRLTSNRDQLIRHLLELDITQQLYNYRDTYGLSTEGYTVSDGWDSPTTKLKGHGTGHYMSALAFAFASAQQPAQREALYLRIERMVQELRYCQERTFVWDDSLGRYREARDYMPEQELSKLQGSWSAMNLHKQDFAHYGYGYLNAIPASHCVLIEKYTSYNNEEGVWAPYYTVHKQLAGLIDIATVMRSVPKDWTVPAGHLSYAQVADKALLIAKDMGLWVWNRLHYRTYVEREGDRAQRRSRPGNRYEMWDMYIAGEVGGMAESLSRLSLMVTEDEDKMHLLEAANCFDAPALFDKVAVNLDDVRTRHANQHIPMFVGALYSYLGNQNPYYYHLSLNFWQMMQGRYTYAMGGVGNGEMWRQPYTQALSMNTNQSGDGRGNLYPNPHLNETCCVYNLLKLTKTLACFTPDDAGLMDYYERAFCNQMVGSVHPSHHAVCYQYAVGLGSEKPFGNETPQSTCCGGTGSESHVKYQEAAYLVSDSTLWVALYLPTRAYWRAKDVEWVQECNWPAEESRLRIVKGGNFAMRLRVPYWATDYFDVRLNGKSVKKHYNIGKYVEIPYRHWVTGDVVEVVMPFTLHVNWAPDKMDVAATGKNEMQTRFSPRWLGALMYGPLVMASPEITSWENAEWEGKSLKQAIFLSKPTHPSGSYGNRYSISFMGKHFFPDYYVTGRATRYLRLNQFAKRSVRSEKEVDLSALQQLVRLATERRKSQEAWIALAVKVPAFAPWAPHGYQRMHDQLVCAQELLASLPRSRSQVEVDSLSSNLRVALNTMRPGSLAEPEDMNRLLSLLTRVKESGAKEKAMQESIDYAEMVVTYVNNGSGTQDLIRKAEERLMPWAK